MNLIQSNKDLVNAVRLIYGYSSTQILQRDDHWLITVEKPEPADLLAELQKRGVAGSS